MSDVETYEDLQQWNTFNTIEVYVVKLIDYIVSCYDTISDIPEYWKKQIHILGHVCKLKNHNQTLAKIVYLKSCFWCNKNMDGYWGKRGRKGRRDFIPVKAIMKALNCSRRTAMDYLDVLDAQKDIDMFYNWCIIESARRRVLESETQHDTISKEVMT